MARDMANPTEQDFEGFREWLGDFGLSDGSIDLYVHNIRRAYHLGGPVKRLRDGDLAPKTRRHILTSCRRWARYRRDEDLFEAVERVRLPAPRRKTQKVPITRDDLFALIDEIDRADYLMDMERAQLGMMAARGFRCADVLRLRRVEVLAGLDTDTLAYEAKGGRRLEFRVLLSYRRYLDMFASYPGWHRVEDLIASRSPPGKRRRQTAARRSARALAVCGAAIGVHGLYPHRLRRTYAVEYLRQLKGDSEALVKLQQHMQWASLATAMEYVDHARGEELDAAAEAIWSRPEALPAT